MQEDEHEQPKTGGAWIDGRILNHKDLSADCKLLYAHIFQLQYQVGYCYASNKYLAELICRSDRSVQRYLKQLHVANIIKIESYDIYDDTRKKVVTKRKIYTELRYSKRKKRGDTAVATPTTNLSLPHDTGVTRNNISKDILSKQSLKVEADNQNLENFSESAEATNLTDKLEEMAATKLSAEDLRK